MKRFAGAVHRYQSSLPTGLTSTWKFWQVKDRQNPIVSVLFTTFSDFFRLIRLYKPCCITTWNTEILTKFNVKSYVIRFAMDIWSTLLIIMLFFQSLLSTVLKTSMLKISDSCQESTSAGVSFWIKIGLSWRPAIKKDIHAQVFFCEC